MRQSWPRVERRTRLEISVDDAHGCGSARDRDGHASHKAGEAQQTGCERPFCPKVQRFW